jgi:hypothetical protein
MALTAALVPASAWDPGDAGAVGSRSVAAAPPASARALGVAPVRSAGLPEQVVTPDCIVDTTGIVGWWRGEDDLTAEIGPDLAGATGFGDGLVRRGFVFGGSDVVGVDGFPAVSTGLTVEMWIKPVRESRTQALATRWDFPSTDDSARAFSLLLSSAGELIFETDETSTRRPELLSAVAPQLFDGNFHHVAATWDQTTMALYVDGVQVGVKASQRGVLNPAVSTPFRLGSKLGIGDPFSYTGTIDEPSIWARALTPAEIVAIEAEGGNGKCTFVPVQSAQLLASNSATNDWFGFAVDIDAARIVVGAPYKSATTQYSGAAYVFVRSGSNWVQEAILTASDGAPVDLFGYSVAISGDTIVVGSYGNDAGGSNSGAAYVFTRSGSAWTQQAKLVAGDAGANDGFGYFLDVSGGSIVIGAPLDDAPGVDAGSAYVFTGAGATWTEQAKLVAADGAAGDSFGLTIGIDADTVVVGSAGDDDAGSAAGSAYVFARSGATWSQQAKLVAADGAAGDLFGFGVAVDGDIATIGAPNDDDAGSNSGSAYVFARSGGAWTQAAKLGPTDAAPGDKFGISVGVDGPNVVVGASGNGAAGSQSGAAYVFNWTGSTWSELVKLIAADGSIYDQFGFSVAISGDIVVGAHYDDAPAGNSGSAYVFTT